MNTGLFFKIAIEKVVALDEQDYINLFMYVLEPFFTPEMEKAIQDGNIAILIDLYENQVKHKLHEAVNEDPSYDEKKILDYFYKILPVISFMLYSDSSIPDEAKYSIIQLEKERTSEQKTIHGERRELVEFENLLLEKDKKFEYARSDKPFHDFLKPQLNIDSPYIFDASMLAEMDVLLRPHYIDDTSGFLPNVFLKDKWRDNQQSINWLKKQNTLLYFIFKLNKARRDFNGGLLSDFICTTFTIKGKKLSESNISKALSKLSRQKKSYEIDFIDTLLKSQQI